MESRRQWDRLDDVIGAIPLGGGDGGASVTLDANEERDVKTFAARLESNPALGGNGQRRGAKAPPASG